MPDKPAREIAVDDRIVRHLLTAQAAAVIPDAATLPVEKVAEGWDCDIWRVGSELAVRLPRREIATPLIRNEQRVLPAFAKRMAATGVRIPAPVFAGAADAVFPWPWSVVPWIDGSRGIDIDRGDRGAWAETLAAALAVLHAPAPADHPVNPFRGVPLDERSPAVRERLARLRVADTLTGAQAAAAASIWDDGLSAQPWAGPALWIHGDLHPANLIAHEGRLVGIIDFGDVTAGDPAYDLAVAWLAFDAAGRDAFVATTDEHYDVPTWVRARAWAVAVSLMLLAHSDDEPAYAALGREAFREVTGLAIG